MDVKLTKTESLILSLLLEERTYREIAQGLVCSRSTVKWHCINICRKAGLSHRNELSQRFLGVKQKKRPSDPIRKVLCIVTR